MATAHSLSWSCRSAAVTARRLTHADACGGDLQAFDVMRTMSLIWMASRIAPAAVFACFACSKRNRLALAARGGWQRVVHGTAAEACQVERDVLVAEVLEA